MSIELTDIRAGYGGFMLDQVTATIKAGELTALIGPNGCGKSTLLKTIARQLPLSAGTVRISGRDTAREPTKAIARQVAVLPQHPVVPPGISVGQLVGYGRAPHQNLFGVRSRTDQEKIEAALEAVAIADLRDRMVSELSGGQRQRAFLAMCVAQDTPYVLLDEPTSFLDIKYQYEVLELTETLHAAGKTIVAVLHDIGHAARFATNLVVMKDGRLYATGTPNQILTPELVEQVYGLRTRVYADPVTGSKMVSPVPNMQPSLGHETARTMCVGLD
ncbi:ABC transporter ATP-binding protein [Shimia sagamensis]|uniref:Iron complex transport system ATP-binding protein n=1 Tax=Shimia sagamensis TaxID=1566352 RepID=A0ABY1P0I6_9RHOB|nr:ABC transporter ATP-binding protein [Shimia sagamensis]SMP23394.1 iron complex transport system ATP-binding protein [Shimia sagamensis]